MHFRTYLYRDNLYVVARICYLESIHSILHLVHSGKDIVA